MITSIDRRRIYIFVAIAYGISVLFAVVIYLNGGVFLKYPFALLPLALTLMSVLMFAPMVANLATRLITREGWSNTLLWPKFRHGWPLYLAALFLPALATIVGGAAYYLLFPERFDPSMAYARATWGTTPVIKGGDAGMQLLLMTPLVIVTSLLNLPRIFGEEFGWRAYLLPKLMPLGGRKAVLLIGLIHGAWHWPFFPMGYNYGFTQLGLPIVAAALLYLVVVTCFSTLFAWVTLRSRSVWPAALAHGTVNNTADLMVSYMRVAPNTLLGPAPLGIIGMLGFILLALPIFLSRSALAPMAAPPPAAAKAVQASAPGAAD